jgi:prepilin-type processing-associated H-X9-DG protein/prepilin-type N-terminal cleavage/methylation domain-containing protein
LDVVQAGEITPGTTPLAATSALSRARSATGGFTILELLAVLSIILVLSSLLLPAIASSKRQAQATICRNNLRQLQVAWLAYCHDHNEEIPPNLSRRFGFDQFNVVTNGMVPWVLGNAKLDTSDLPLTAGCVFTYVSSSAPFRCPSDRATVRNETSLLRKRSYSIHEFLNCNIVSSADIDSINNDPANFRKLGQWTKPSPGETWVLIDEHPVSIDDGVFAIHGGPPEAATFERDAMFWGSFPGDGHDNGANLSFADGHVVYHKWRAHRVGQHYFGDRTYIRASDSNNLLDLHWLEYRLPYVE